MAVFFQLYYKIGSGQQFLQDLEGYNCPVSDIRLNVHVVIFRLQGEHLQILLAPRESKWEIPSAFVQPTESLEETAERAFMGHVDRKDIYLEQLYTYGDPDRDADQRLVSVVYFALAPADAICNPDSTPLRWFQVDALPNLNGDHAEIIAYALRRLRYKLEYTAAGFQLLPDEFTLSELQHTYEIILGERLDKRNFRRRILEAGIIEATSHYRSGEGRPARLYRYRSDAVAEVKTRRLFP